MVQYLHFRILEFPLNDESVSRFFLSWKRRWCGKQGPSTSSSEFQLVSSVLKKRNIKQIRPKKGFTNNLRHYNHCWATFHMIIWYHNHMQENSRFWNSNKRRGLPIMVPFLQSIIVCSEARSDFVAICLWQKHNPIQKWSHDEGRTWWKISGWERTWWVKIFRLWTPLIHGFIYLLQLGLKGSNVSPFLPSTGYLTVCYVKSSNCFGKSSIYQKYITNGPFSSMFHTCSIHFPQCSP